MKKIISFIFLLVYVLTSNAQTMIDQRINLSGSTSLSLAIPSDFCYNKKPMLQLSKNENYSDEKMFIYDENLNMVKTINTGQSKSFDYQLTYQDEVRDITEVFTKEEKRAWLDQMTDVALGSDAFFPFSDNIERAKKSGVKYIAEPGGSVRDDLVIECADKYGMVMCFTKMRLFHH